MNLRQQEEAQAHNNGKNRSSQQENFNDKLRTGLNNFSASLVEVINDITALEVNTMIVSEIRGTKFISEEAYQNIYFCLSRGSKIPNKLRKLLKDELNKVERIANLTDEDRIPPGFRDESYKDEDGNIEPIDKIANDLWRLREKLTREYIQIFFQEVYDPNKNLPADLPSNLPFPYTIIESTGPDYLRLDKHLTYILTDERFLRSLRKVSELQAAINNEDNISAQTVIQLDGDVINRYRRDLFENPDKQLIINIHNQGVAGAENQWRGLVKSAVDLVLDIIGKLGNGRP